MCKRILSMTILVGSLAWAQPQASQSSSMPGMVMSRDDTARGAAGSQDGIKEMPGMDSESSEHAMQSMENHHMDMGPHMKMTALRAPKPGDQERAQQVVEAARRVAGKYQDYHTALAEGFKIFHPDVPQKMYHFTNYKYAFEAAFAFNPEHPTSLLYEKQGDDYKLVGVMYTAPKRSSEDDLDKRIPLSIAQWHEHVNLCFPPPDRKKEAIPPHAKFGLAGSISTEDECQANGGKFMPIVFNWMVHVYPRRTTEAGIWDVTRGHDRDHGD